MPQLSELQKHWQEAVMTENPVPVRNAILQPPRDSVDTRIEIYTEAYFLRLLEILGVIYPYLKQYLGESKFNEMAKEYFRQHPSTYTAVRVIGNQLPLFLESYSNDKVISELAALELAISNAVDCTIVKPLTQSDLQQIPQEKWGGICFVLQPAFMLLSFSTNAIKIYEAMVQHKSIPESQTVEQYHCRVFKKNLQVFYLVIKKEESFFLKLLLKQSSFSKICEDLCSLLPEEEVVNYAIAQLLRWLEDELIVEAIVEETQ